MKKDEIKEIVKEGYGQIAKKAGSCCGPIKSCCGNKSVAKDISQGIGYAADDLNSLPEGANLGLGCGNPIALASLKAGETVLDLGSGGGIDCFLAAQRVGESGRVIGVDMTPEMIDKAKANARRSKYRNIEFRLGEIESLPVDDNSVDVIISNCVINLSPDKPKVFKEAFRVLKPGGRLMVSDIVLLKELPDKLKKSVSAYVGCLSGAIRKDDYLNTLKTAGFKKVRVLDENVFPIKYMANDQTAQAAQEALKITAEELSKASDAVASIKVSGIK
jgi:arsenite methyltransferase